MGRSAQEDSSGPRSLGDGCGEARACVEHGFCVLHRPDVLHSIAAQAGVGRPVVQGGDQEVAATSRASERPTPAAADRRVRQDLRRVSSPGASNRAGVRAARPAIGQCDQDLARAYWWGLHHAADRAAPVRRRRSTTTPGRRNETRPLTPDGGTASTRRPPPDRSGSRPFAMNRPPPSASAR